MFVGKPYEYKLKHYHIQLSAGCGEQKSCVSEAKRCSLLGLLAGLLGGLLLLHDLLLGSGLLRGLLGDLLLGGSLLSDFLGGYRRG